MAGTFFLQHRIEQNNAKNGIPLNYYIIYSNTYRYQFKSNMGSKLKKTYSGCPIPLQKCASHKRAKLSTTIHILIMKTFSTQLLIYTCYV